MIYWLLFAKKVLKSFTHWTALILYFSSKQLWAQSFHFPNDVLNFHSHSIIVFKVFFKTRPILIFFPVHFQSNNLFEFKFASLVHSYSYLVKSSLSKIIFSNHFSRPRLHLDTFHFHFDFLFSFSWLSLFHLPFYLKFSFTLHLPGPGSHQ